MHTTILPTIPLRNSLRSSHSTSGSYSGMVNAPSDNELPSIVLSSQGNAITLDMLAMTRPPVAISEANVVKTSANDNHDSAWTHQQLSMSDNTQKTRAQWENELARRILSLYASSSVKKDLQNSHQLLDFVVERNGDSEEAEKKPQKGQSVPPKSSTLGPISERSVTSQQGQEHENDKDFENPKKFKTNMPKKKKKNKTRTMNHTSTIVTNPTISDVQVQEQEELTIKRQMIRDLLEKVKASQRLVRTRDKYRVVNTIRSSNGKVITVRGAPRVFPVWFLADKDALANWTALPGGRKLQAHLHVLYENGYWRELIDILQALLLQLWRERVYGQESFDANLVSRSAVPGTPSASRTRSSAAVQRPPSHPQSKGHTEREYNSLLSRASSAAASSREWFDAILDEKLTDPVRNELNMRFDALPSDVGRNVNVPVSAEMPSAAVESFNITPLLSTQELGTLWRQLVLTTVAIGLRCIEAQRYEEAMGFLQNAELFAKNDDLLTLREMRRECSAHIKDAMGYYFFRRDRPVAALSYCEKALHLFDERDEVEGVAQALLHIAAVHSLLGKFQQSHKVLYQILAMVDSGRLSTVAATPKQLCLVAVTYHNLAVLQLKLGLPDLACKHSLDARKIARLCLSYSNRFIDAFQYTHEVALSDMQHDLESLELDPSTMTQKQMDSIKELAIALFSVGD